MPYAFLCRSMTYGTVKVTLTGASSLQSDVRTKRTQITNPNVEVHRTKETQVAILQLMNKTNQGSNLINVGEINIAFLRC